MEKVTATGKIYLGTSFTTEVQQERVKKARTLLTQNPTVNRIHMPFDYNFVDPDEEDPKIGGMRSLSWQLNTFKNDINGIINASCGVFLYDMDELDDGCAFEIGFMRANHMPVILVPFTKKADKPKKMNLMIAQGVTAIIDGNTELEKLATYDFNWTPAIPVTGYGIY